MRASPVDGCAQALNVARGGDGDHVNPRDAGLADGSHHFQPGDIGQINVEQDEVGPGRVDQAQRFGARGRLANDGEARDLLDVVAVQRGDAKVIVDDQCANHAVATGTGLAVNGSRTVKSAPPWFSTVTSPPRRAATRLT